MAGEAWKARRALSRIRVFGSFEDQDIKRLDQMIESLFSSGYHDIARVQIQTDKRLDDAALRERCLREAVEAPLAVFVFFFGTHEPNQSSLQELAERLRRFQEIHGIEPGPGNTILLAEEGVKIKTLLRGLLKESGIENPEQWTDIQDLTDHVRGWLLWAGPS